MSASLLETIVRDAKVAFLVAKHDGQLEAAEVVQIAVTISKKVHALENLSPAEKGAFVMLCLKKGLSAADGLHGLAVLAESGPEGMAAAEHQILSAGLAAAKALQDAVPELFAPVKNALQACLPYFAHCTAAVAVLDPKDSALIQQALQCVQAVAKDLSGNAIQLPNIVVSILESAALKGASAAVGVVVKADPIVQLAYDSEWAKAQAGIPPLNTPAVEPSPAASQ